ncbi:TPA: hypothetical protein L4559_005115 [Pseudomonas aeruginosa]|nr:hypothetical protein [Pseudomonas aeruginosa]
MFVVSNFLLSICSHAWLVLTFKHRGDGIATLAAATRLTVLILAGVMIGLCTYFAPGDERATAALMAVVHFGIFSALMGHGEGGASRQAMFAILMIAIEPVGLSFRWAPGLYFMDQILTVWVLVAGVVFIMKSEGKVPSRGQREAPPDE